MKKALSLVISTILIVLTSGVLAQEKTSQTFKGYPSAEGKIDIRENFENPPKGYGNVPFFWWTGDSLKIDRLAYELELLAHSPTEGFAVSYNHTHANVDILANAKGHAQCGVADEGSPKVFSEDWWKIWNEFSGMCADKGMGVGFDDYVLAWPGNNSFMDKTRNDGEFDRYQGKLHFDIIPHDKGLPHNMVMSKKWGNDSLIVVYTTASCELHPKFGAKLIENYFQPFWDKMDSRGREGMNYFFQDELTYHPALDSWCEDMPEEFKQRKGYDIVPHLPALFMDMGEETVKTRLDYAQVVSDLAEERFFKPIYDWNASRGLIYGCDNNGRGLKPTEYMDYFKENSWFTAPGNDAPARGSSFTQTKVSSSIAHLYQRPRTWLEAFHSMGWNANGAVLTHQLDHHIIAGGNLLCMHGLYYSTHGGWWEWAPPSFHFRMPYWPHMKKWLKYAQRLCFILSQGRHVCDVAILYPTETIQAIPGANFDFCKEVSDSLSVAGIDFDFIDFRSLQNADMSGGRICVAGEKYKILVLAGIKAMHSETAEAIRKFERSGGRVLRIDEDASKAVDFVCKNITRDFIPQSGHGRVLHRHIADNDVYMIMDVKKGDKVFLRSHGKLERWDAMSGKISQMPVLDTDANGTWIKFDEQTGNSMLLVFSPGEAVMAGDKPDAGKGEESVIVLDGLWKTDIIPTMDNRWGDFRLPATEGRIGVEARSFRCYELSHGMDAGVSVWGYGPFMMTSRDGKDWKPYCWSWQYGVYDSPGSQGYHGLKGKVDSRFIILDKGGNQYFKTYVFAPERGKYRILREGTAPNEMKIDGKSTRRNSIRLSQGWHELWLKYSNTRQSDYNLSALVAHTIDDRDRSMVMFLPADAPLPKETDLYDNIVASKWYGSKCLRYNPFKKDDWIYYFDSAPGALAFETKVNGKVKEIFIDGNSIPFIQEEDEVTCYMNVFNPKVSSVRIIASPDSYSPGAAFFKEPVKITCGQGLMPLGDWSSQGAMKYFSGGVKYSKEFYLESSEGSWKVELGDVDATCEVWINAQKVDELLSAPYSVDVTPYVREGSNTIEVIVYSSLANHYSTIPTPYRGKAHAGLIGPVTVKNIR